MNPSSRLSQKGSLLLVVMCFLAVLGIVLAGYLSVSNSAMKLSNRAEQATVSEQLAEMGLAEALRAFNTNDWHGWALWTAGDGTTFSWTKSGTTASCTITLPSGSYGTNGVTAVVKVRVDNYNANQLPATWNSSTNYLPGNIVGYTDGTWYRCLSSHSNKSPSATSSNDQYWLQEQSPVSAAVTWISGTNYVIGNMVLRNGSWYRCRAAHTSSTANSPPNTTYWYAVSAVAADGDLRYTNESIVRYYLPTYGNDSWYRYSTVTSGWDNVATATGGSAWTLTWHWTSSTAYNVGDVVVYNNIWYRCKTAHTSGASFSATNWDTSASLSTTAAASWAWSSTATYNLNDMVYYSSRWYRSISAANSGNTPSTTSSYWSTSPLLSITWDSSRQYNANDTVLYNGVWYLSLLGSNYGQNPATASTYWIGANTANSSYIWNSASSYSVGNYRCYGGVWYKCLAANSNTTPNNSTYWTASWTNNANVTTGAPVVYSEGRATLPDSTSTIKTQLRATLAPASLFPNAVGATAGLTISTGTGTVDSYDSTAGSYGGSNVGYSAVLAGGSSLAISGTTAVSGYLAWPSPPAGISSNTTVWGPSSPASPKVDASRLSRSPYVPQFDIHTVASSSVALAASTGWASGGLTLGTAGATSPTYYSYSGNLNMSSSTNNMIKIVGPVVLDIQGNLHIQTSPYCRITIAETGSLELHVSGRLRLDSTGGGIDNQTLDPKKCVILSTSTSGAQNVSFAYSNSTTPATPAFYGCIYMPNEDLTVDTGVIVYGAISARNVTFSSEATVHYDTSLRYVNINGVDQPYAIAQWRELTDPNERAVLP